LILTDVIEEENFERGKKETYERKGRRQGKIQFKSVNKCNKKYRQICRKSTRCKKYPGRGKIIFGRKGQFRQCLGSACIL
jgi:hypothetical protein